MNKFYVKEEYVKKMQAKKELQKYLEGLTEASYNKDDLLDYLDKNYSSVYIPIDIAKKQNYLYCFTFTMELGGIVLDTYERSLGCDMAAIELDNELLDRINNIVSSMVVW